MEETITSEPVVDTSDDFEIDERGNFINKKPAVKIEPQAKPDLKSIAKSEFDNANKELNTTKDMRTDSSGEKKEPFLEDEKPVTPEKKKYKIKYEGKEEEVEADDREISDALQMKRDYTKKMQAVSEQRKQAEQVFNVMNNLKQDPNAIFDFANQYLGHDIEKIAEQRLLEKMKYELMPQHERQAYDLTKENSQLKMELDKRTQSDKQAEEQAAAEAKALQDQEQDEKFVQSIGEFFDSKGIEPSNDQLIDVLNMLMRYVDTPNPLTIEQAWSKVDAREQSKRNSFLKTLKHDELPDEIKKALRQADVEKIKTNRPWQNSPKKEQPAPKPQGRKAVSTDEYFKEMEKEFR